MQTGVSGPRITLPSLSVVRGGLNALPSAVNSLSKNRSGLNYRPTALKGALEACISPVARVCEGRLLVACYPLELAAEDKVSGREA